MRASLAVLPTLTNYSLTYRSRHNCAGNRTIQPIYSSGRPTSRPSSFSLRFGLSTARSTSLVDSVRRGAYPEGKAVTTNREGCHTVPRRTSRGCQCHPAGRAKFGRLISVTRRVAIPISRLCHGEGAAHLSYLSPSGLNPCFFCWLPTHTSLGTRGSDHPQTLSPPCLLSPRLLLPSCRSLRSLPCMPRVPTPKGSDPLPGASFGFGQLTRPSTSSADSRADGADPAILPDLARDLWLSAPPVTATPTIFRLREAFGGRWVDLTCTATASDARRPPFSRRQDGSQSRVASARL